MNFTDIFLTPFKEAGVKKTLITLYILFVFAWFIYAASTDEFKMYLIGFINIFILYKFKLVDKLNN